VIDIDINIMVVVGSKNDEGKVKKSRTVEAPTTCAPRTARAVAECAVHSASFLSTLYPLSTCSCTTFSLPGFLTNRIIAFTRRI
jgi:hypothetical protein